MRPYLLTTAILMGTTNIGTAEPLQLGENLRYLDSALLFSSKDQGEKEGGDFWLEGYFEAGEFHLGGMIWLDRDPNAGETIRNFEADIGYNLTEKSYVELRHGKYDDVTQNAVFS